MDQINYLTDLIYKALKNSNNDLRQKAEADLVQIRTTNPVSFFSTCAKLISHTHND